MGCNHQLDNVLFDHFVLNLDECICACKWFHHDVAQAPLRIPLNGSALRPWCHFEVPVSDYRAMRQAADVLDPKYEVVLGRTKKSDALALDVFEAWKPEMFFFSRNNWHVFFGERKNIIFQVPPVLVLEGGTWKIELIYLKRWFDKPWYAMLFAPDLEVWIF